MGVNRAFREPPLAFSGNKKYWAAELADEAALLPPGATVWDCFGGSGVCARCVKDARPDVRVIWNDFDGYSERLRHVAESEELRKTLLRVCGSESDDGFRRKLSPSECDAVQAACVAHRARYQFLDGVLVSRWTSIGAPSGPYNPDRPRRCLYAHVPERPLRVNTAAAWLDGLEVVRQNVTALPVGPNDFVIIDPPYVETACDEYARGATLAPIRHSAELMRGRKFVLFGDASISFFYDILTEKYAPRFFIKRDIVAGAMGKKTLGSHVLELVNFFFYLCAPLGIIPTVFSFRCVT